MKKRSFLTLLVTLLLVPLIVTVAKEKKRAPIEPTAPRDFGKESRDINLSAKAIDGRAHQYAPPPISHTIDNQTSVHYCMECHAPENNIAKKHKAIAPLPHPVFSQCLQCHVPGKDADKVELFRKNSFIGLVTSGKGSRAHDYAPPTVPHKIMMRENCLSCHGPKGDADFRTKHPERSQCFQCHVPEAGMDYTRPR